jgi:hypothetical protein
MLMLRRVVVVLAGVLALGVLGAPAAFAEEGCPNEAMRQAEAAARPEGFATGLPDCRAYEQVTPVNKDGTNPTGSANGIQASPDGERIVFDVPANMPGASSGQSPQPFLGTRGGQGWSDVGLTAPVGPYGASNVIGWSEDLSEAVVQATEVIPGAAKEVYLRDNATGSLQAEFPDPSRIFVAGFSADNSRMIFETTKQLLPSAAAGSDNLYELHDGIVSLVGVLPDGSTPPGGSVAGRGGALSSFYTENTISSDGSRMFFTAGGTEQIYVRENGTSTVPVGVGAFMAATPDGSKAFYLTAGGDLTEFDVDDEQTTDLTPGGSVQGVLGVSDDGSYVYFVANGVLASGASPGNCAGVSSTRSQTLAGSCGLYVWHDGIVSFIAMLTDYETNYGGDQVSDVYDWAPSFSNGTGVDHSKTSRVTPDGRTLLFGSLQRLTSYDNAGVNEIYRYDAVHGRLSCVSCDPTGAPPSGSAELASIKLSYSSSKEPSILTRNLSEGGSRVFFESSDALVPRDINGVQDVYEWEQQGVGSCQGSSESFSVSSGGCLYLVSSGRSPDRSFFADASASGDDAFFFTDQPLVGQDQDGLVDVYDAHVGGGLAAQSPPAPPAPCEGEGCKPVAGAVPVFGAPVSASFSGTGNQALPVAAPVVASKSKAKAKAKAKKHKTVKARRKKRRRAGRGARSAGVRGATRGGR